MRRTLLLLALFLLVAGAATAQTAAGTSPAERDSIAEALHQRARSLTGAGRSYPAIALMDEVIDIRSTLDTPYLVNYSRSLYLLSSIHYDLGNWAESEYYVKRAFAVLERADPAHPKYQLYRADQLYHLANLATLMEDCYLGRLRIEAFLNQLRDHPDAYYNPRLPGLRAAGAMACGEPERAETILQAGIADTETSQLDPEELAYNHYRLSNAINAQGRDADFAEAWQRATALLEQLAPDIERVRSQLAGHYTERIIALIEAGRLTEAEELLETGLTVARQFFTDEIGDNLSELYLQAGRLYTKLGDTTRAEDYFARATRSLVDDPTLTGPARLPRIGGNVIYSQKMLLALLTAKRNLLRETTGPDRPAALETALGIQASVDSVLRIDRERLNLNASLTAANRNRLEWYEDAIGTALTLYREGGEERFLERAWQIAAGLKSDLMRRFLTGNDLAASFGVPPDLVEGRNALALRLAVLERALRDPERTDRTAIRDSILDYDNQLSQLNRRIEADHPRFAAVVRGGREVSWSDAREALPADLVVLEYFVGNDSIYVFTLDAARGLRYRVLPPVRNLAQRATAVVNDAATTSELFPLVLGRVIDDLPSGVDRLQIVPDGPLWNLPFAALRRDGRFLVEDYAISYAYSTRQLFDPEFRGAVAEAERVFAGFGLSYERILRQLNAGGVRSIDNRSLASLAALPYARREVEEAGQLLGGDFWLDEGATKENFLRAGGAADILHLAMHGLLDEQNPYGSALVFAGGADSLSLLTMREVLQLRLRGQLAVLSACHTGQGPLEDREGSQSIARAFTLAGVRTTLASNWEASDRVTHFIIGRFYADLKAGVPLDRALRSATLAYLAEAGPTERQPEFWANLSLVGPTTPLEAGKQSSWLLGLLTLAGLGLAGLALWYFRYRTGAERTPRTGDFA